MNSRPRGQGARSQKITTKQGNVSHPTAKNAAQNAMSILEY